MKLLQFGKGSALPNFKLLIIMKLTAFFILFAVVHVNANTYSQKVSIKGNNLTLPTIFKSLKKQTGFQFVYIQDVIIQSRSVTLDLENVELVEVLDKCLKHQNLGFEITDKIITIKPVTTGGLNPRLTEQGFNPASPPPITVRGRILNENNEPVIASVIIKGKNRGTTSNADGFFELAGVDEKDIIIFSGTNINTREVAVEGRSVINISVLLKISTEQEVIVKTNYYSTTKRLSTGNISKVTSKEISNQPVTSPLMALQGRVPGLEITMPANSTPGIAPKIRIRGNNSLRIVGKNANYDGNYPLYVIDGVPVSSAELNPFQNFGDLAYGGFDPLSSISPENIESIEILKDADATAIYGSRGANGVILITTKRVGLNKERTDLDINVYHGGGQVPKKMDLLNTEQYLTMRREALSNDGIIARDDVDFDLKYWDPSRYTDWQEVLTGGTAHITDIQTAVSSSNQYTAFRLGGGFHKETLVFPGNYGYYRISGQFSVNHTSKSRKFKLSAVTNYGLEKNKLFSGEASVASRLTLPPNAPKLYNDDGSLNWEMHNVNGTMKSTWINPLSYLLNISRASNENLVSNATLSYQLFPGLALQTSMGYSSTLSSSFNQYPGTSQKPDENLLNATSYRRMTVSETKQMSWIIEPKLEYTKKYGEHQLDAIVGTTWQKSVKDYNILHGVNYSSDALLNSLQGAGRIDIYADETTEYKYTSVYGRVGYNWQQKYLLNLTGRRDGSSRFGPNNRFGTFGAIGVGWILSEEKWIKEFFPTLTFGKLRSSYGITGSDAVADYRFYDLYSLMGLTYQGAMGFVPDALYNPDFKWESTKKLELAIELGFFNNRLGMEVNWYRNRSSNQLIDYMLPEVTGFAFVVSNFDATVQNTGWEAVLHGTPLNSNHFRWNVSFNISVPRNKLAQFKGIDESPYATKFKVGEPLSIQWLYNYQGVNTETGLYEFQDLNKDGEIDDFDKQLMNPKDRKYYGGVNNIFQYHNLEISFLFQYSDQPGIRYLPGLPGNGSMLNQSIVVLDRWFTPGDQTNIQRFTTGGVTGETYQKYSRLQQSSFITEDASFIRLKTFALSYSVQNRWLKKIKLQHAKLFLQGQNLLTITRYSGLDPETGSGVPPLRMITGGVQLRL